MCWTVDFPRVVQLTSITKLLSHKDYMAAKAGDIDAAYRLTYDILTDKKRLLKIKALKVKYPNAVYVGVHAEERNGKNKIPEALAQFIGNLTGQAVDTEIIQTVKAGRTGQGEMYRLAYRPKFDGHVQAGKEYILVDDVISRGGTFGELKFYIEQCGGKVVQMVAAAAGRFSTCIALTEKTKNVLIKEYGIVSLQRFLRELDIYAGNVGYLTESEARRILEAGPLDRTTNRIIEIRQARNA